MDATRWWWGTMPLSALRLLLGGNAESLRDVFIFHHSTFGAPDFTFVRSSFNGM
jgi:hypothetical protein